ncbi:TPA: ogr/Delta-like zinc finger family protein [Klebsiella aerogenes]|uniref:ogr/Delta-like zinc finger family protein n=1 Tax=Enterobacteriaceae TaxID=543 RepID=UPI000B40B0B7|nr:MULTISPECIES: ogr/Delta-like zinc finger family protein [Enterobacteriaceae]EJE1165979.1 ogr/Delta-like zinc finger family protein [Cronobacter sakazakii]ELQ3583720.1 ogr/Delta-like zinc finger family protein [Cronobacter sakazakii]ELY2647872.1 ogr/Delta-like zinc finger family protein [Cronobacter sakazakii]ELY3418480.1 ogr/Delta-like zinc finger family protein [Cronobacter sakazakii]ELY4099887.1 ogr/Delta-like zinc finger family protein [Cronobacter sakazakii]
MRIMKMTCPACLAEAKIRKTNRKHPQLADVYCQCSNMECGHTFVMNVSFSHTISPSALAGQGRIKELIDSLGENERKKALALLQAAEEKH